MHVIGADDKSFARFHWFLLHDSRMPTNGAGVGSGMERSSFVYQSILLLLERSVPMFYEYVEDPVRLGYSVLIFSNDITRNSPAERGISLS